MPQQGRLHSISWIKKVALHEWSLVVLGAVVLASLMDWPSLWYASSTVPGDLGDPLAQTYLLSWPGHILLINPGQLWNSNTFFPELDSFAFSDSLLGYAPFSFIGDGQEAAIIRFNLLFIAVHALSFIGAYALVRQLGSHWSGAVLAGVAFAFAPWTYGHSGHFNILSTGGIALALAALCRGHGFSLLEGYRREKVRPGWVVAGWLIAAWQISIGFAIGLPFFYVLLGLCLLVAANVGISWFKYRQFPLPPRLLVANGVGGTIFGLVTLYMAAPSLRLVERHEETQRAPSSILRASPPWRGLFTAPSNSNAWGGWREDHLVGIKQVNEVTVLPGFVLLACAAAGVLFSIWHIWTRLALLTALFVSTVLTMGNELAGGRYSYMVLYNLLPGWDAMRTPGRLILWGTLLLTILAAGFISRIAKTFAQRLQKTSSEKTPRNRRRKLLVPTLLLPAFLAALEGTNSTAHPRVPIAPAALQTVAGPVLVLPSNSPYDTRVMLWSADSGYVPVVNGASSIIPKSQVRILKTAEQLPDSDSFNSLRGVGIRSVLVVRDDVRGTPYEQLLNIRAEQLPPTVTRTSTPDAVTFTLKPLKPPQPDR
jgi:hypothetical protein